MYESKYHANMVELSLPENRLEVGFNPNTIFEVVTTVEDADEHYVAVVGYLWRENVTEAARGSRRLQACGGIAHKVPH